MLANIEDESKTAVQLYSPEFTLIFTKQTKNKKLPSNSLDTAEYLNTEKSKLN